MRLLSGCACCLVLFAVLIGVASGGADEEKWTDLTSLDVWKEPTAGWMLADRVEVDPKNPRKLTAAPGKGILVNGPKGRAPDLQSKQDFGDAEVHVEFFIAQKSNSGVKLQGLYEVQVYDSHGVKEPTASDCGGIYPRAELKPKYHYIDKGFPPRLNAAKPAGEWQTLVIIFQAPRFDAVGKKTANARFVKVVLNGQLIHEQLEVPTPTGHAWHDREVPVGPLLLQGDHGPVAFRNVRIRPLTAK
jgi:hypothetical protein